MPRHLSSVPERPFDGPKQALSKPKPHEVSPDVREAIWRRCGGLCECCGQPMHFTAMVVHHRKRRGQGGDDSVTNLVAVHALCHNRIHSNVGWSREAGFLVSMTAQPGRIKLALFGERWVRLARDASYVEAA